MGFGGQGQLAWDEDEVVEDIVRILSDGQHDKWSEWIGERVYDKDRPDINGRSNLDILKKLCPSGKLYLWLDREKESHVGTCEFQDKNVGTNDTVIFLTLNCDGFETLPDEMRVECDLKTSSKPVQLTAHDFGY